jgi:hypothetical protein
MGLFSFLEPAADRSSSWTAAVPQQVVQTPARAQTPDEHAPAAKGPAANLDYADQYVDAPDLKYEAGLASGSAFDWNVRDIASGLYPMVDALRRSNADVAALNAALAGQTHPANAPKLEEKKRQIVEVRGSQAARAAFNASSSLFVTVDRAKKTGASGGDLQIGGIYLRSVFTALIEQMRALGGGHMAEVLEARNDAEETLRGFKVPDTMLASDADLKFLHETTEKKNRESGGALMRALGDHLEAASKQEEIARDLIDKPGLHNAKDLAHALEAADGHVERVTRFLGDRSWQDTPEHAQQIQKRVKDLALAIAKLAARSRTRSPHGRTRSIVDRIGRLEDHGDEVLDRLDATPDPLYRYSNAAVSP